MAGVHYEQSKYWQECWRSARANMPRYYKTQGQGSVSVLMLLLGYAVNQKSVGNRYWNKLNGGFKPREPEAAKLLPMLAGPHGSTIAKAIALNKGIDLSKWKYWP